MLQCIATINTVLIITNKQVTLFQSTSNIQLKVNPKRKSIVSASISPIATVTLHCVCFRSCFQRLFQLLLLDCIHFSCCSTINCVLAAPRLHPLQQLLPDCICTSCCSPIMSAPAAATRSCVPRSCCFPTASVCRPSQVLAPALHSQAFFAKFKVRR